MLTDMEPFFWETERFNLPFPQEIVLGAALGVFLYQLRVNLWPWPQKEARRWEIGELSHHVDTSYRGGSVSADILTLTNCQGDVREEVVIQNGRIPIGEGWVYLRDLRGVRSSVPPSSSPFLRGLRIFMQEDVTAEQVRQGMYNATIWSLKDLTSKRLYPAWPFK